MPVPPVKFAVDCIGTIGSEFGYKAYWTGIEGTHILSHAGTAARAGGAGHELAFGTISLSYSTQWPAGTNFVGTYGKTLEFMLQSFSDSDTPKWSPPARITVNAPGRWTFAGDARQDDNPYESVQWVGNVDKYTRSTSADWGTLRVSDSFDLPGRIFGSH